LHAILHDPVPPLPALGPAVSAEAAQDVQRIVAKCLEKDPAARYQGMRDLVVDLRAARRRLESAAVSPIAPAPAAQATGRGSRTRVAAALAAVIVLAVAAVIMQWPRRSDVASAGSSK